MLLYIYVVLKKCYNYGKEGRNMKKISIVVPVYNVQKYLSKCIDSLINQTYKDIEIILVDDGSLDGSGNICDAYAKKDKRIKVIHKKNGGLSDARNKGIEIATGEYITFIDSDDYVSLKYCETLYKLIKKHNADISIGNYHPFYENEIVKEKIDDNEIVMSSKEALEYLYDKDYCVTMRVAWGKLYKKELFNKIRYPKGKINEDEFVIHHLYDKTNKVVFTKSTLYYYFQRDTSIMGEKFSIKRLDALEALKERIEFFDKKGFKKLKFKACTDYNHFIKVNYYNTKDKNLKKKLKENLLPVSYFKDYFKLKNYIGYYLFKLCPSIYKMLISK